MEQDKGVPASPSGSQASPAAPSGSAPSVSIPNALKEALGGIVSMCADERDIFPDDATAIQCLTEAVNELYACLEDGVFGAVRSGTPYPEDWIYTRGTAPDLWLNEVIWALGRYGDVYGPLPFEMIDKEAWAGNMGHASCDLVAYAPCEALWRNVFPYQPRDPSVFGLRATASAIEAPTGGETPLGGSTEGESAVPQADARD